VIHISNKFKSYAGYNENKKRALKKGPFLIKIKIEWLDYFNNIIF